MRNSVWNIRYKWQETDEWCQLTQGLPMPVVLKKTEHIRAPFNEYPGAMLAFDLRYNKESNEMRSVPFVIPARRDYLIFCRDFLLAMALPITLWILLNRRAQRRNTERSIANPRASCKCNKKPADGTG